MMEYTLSWGRKKYLVSSETELLQTVAQVQAASEQAGIPIAVGLSIDDRGLIFVVGDPERSLVSFFENMSHTYSSNGCSDEPSFRFLFFGSVSEVENYRTVASDLARKAMIEFYRTSERPSNINWSS